MCHNKFVQLVIVYSHNNNNIIMSVACKGVMTACMVIGRMHPSSLCTVRMCTCATTEGGQFGTGECCYMDQLP
jgi:hypothetical protein